MTDPVNSKPAPGRNWLLAGGSVLLTVIGIVMIARYMTGHTIKEERAAMERAREERELANKAPGNADTFSARLAQRAKQIADDDAKLVPPAAASVPPTAAAASAPNTAPGQATKRPNDPAQRALQTPLILPQAGTGESDVDGYQALKDSVAKDATRRMGAWESQDTRRGSQSPEEMLLTALTKGPSGQGDAAPGPATSSALVQALDRVQSAQSASSQARDDGFLRKVATDAEATPLVPQSGLGPFAVLEGTSIPVVMRTRVSSDLGGPCKAQVTQNVYDTSTGRNLLVPAGTTVICTYNPEVSPGQEKILLAFTRMIFPGSGASVRLTAFQGADPQGTIGAVAAVNNRFWKIFGSSFLIAGVTRLAQNASQSSVTINLSSGASGSAAQALSDVAHAALARNISIKPELTLEAGDLVHVVVARDMVLSPSITGVRK